MSVTSAPASIPFNLLLSPSSNAPSEGFTCKVDMVTALIPAKSVTSESINAPAAVTFAVSVTSAPVSIPSNLSVFAVIASDWSLVIVVGLFKICASPLVASQSD